MKRFFISHNGCEPTAFDAQRIERTLLSHGAVRCSTSSEADVVVFLGCTFTREKELELEREIESLLKNESFRLIVIAGCFLAHYRNDERLHFVRTGDVANFLQPHLIEGDPLNDDVARLGQTQAASGDKPIITISDGCYGSCTFCSIKTVRGTHKSRPIREILADIAVVSDSARTLKLTGIEVAGYGLDCGYSLAWLLKQIHHDFPRLCIELGSMNPKLLKRMPEADLEILGADFVTGNFHFPLESASSKVLRDMQRGYSWEDYADLWQRLSRAGVTSFSTDLIAGFPTESAQDHQASLRFLDEYRLEFAQLFFFEPRPGTEAAAMPGHPRDLRVDRMLELLAHYSATYMLARGLEMNALVSGAVSLPFNTNLNLNNEELIA